jgi:hypothetical protein
MIELSSQVLTDSSNTNENQTLDLKTDYLTVSEDDNKWVSLSYESVLYNDGFGDDLSDLKVGIDLTTLPTKGLIHMNYDGTFAFNPNGDFEYLPEGKNEIVPIRYFVDTPEGRKYGEIQITVEGKNDAPRQIRPIEFHISERGYFTISDRSIAEYFEDVDEGDELKIVGFRPIVNNSEDTFDFKLEDSYNHPIDKGHYKVNGFTNENPLISVDAFLNICVMVRNVMIYLKFWLRILLVHKLVQKLVLS